MISRPAVALPEPLRAAEIPSFTNYSVVVRLPDIARRTLKENDFSPEAVAQIQALINEIPQGKIRPVDIPLAADADRWQQSIQPYLGQDWLEIPWFFAEEYFYLRILEATGYFQPGPGCKRDPYASQKRLGLQSSRAAIQGLAEQVVHVEHRPASAERDSLARLLLNDLWGNQNDLSLWPVQESVDGGGLTGGSAASSSPEDAGASDESHDAMVQAMLRNVLSDDLSAALNCLESFPPNTARVDILLDNVGYELACDLVLADFLLASRRATRVTLHAKAYPVFVSDVIEPDIYTTLDFLVFEGQRSCKDLAIRLRHALLSEKLVLRHHPFWTSPQAAWEMPADLQAELAPASLIISKGDANYRRLLGDRHWPIDLPFSSVVDYLPCPMLALRTLKSEIAVGVDPTRIPTSDPEWMINGRWGLIEFSPSRLQDEE